jgi:hypothetical protein
MELVDARCTAPPGTRYDAVEQQQLADLLEEVVSSGPAIRAVREHLRIAGPAPARLKNRLPEIAKWIKDHCDDVIQDMMHLETSRDGVTTIAMTVAGTGGAGTAAALGAVIAGGTASAGLAVSALVATGGIAGPLLFGGGLAVYLVRKRQSARNKRLIEGARRLGEAIVNRDRPV